MNIFVSFQAIRKISVAHSRPKSVYATPCTPTLPHMFNKNEFMTTNNSNNTADRQLTIRSDFVSIVWINHILFSDKDAQRSIALYNYYPLKSDCIDMLHNRIELREFPREILGLLSQRTSVGRKLA